MAKDFDWEFAAVKLATFWLMLLNESDDKFSVKTMLIRDGLTKASSEVAAMVIAEHAEPSDEELHEMMLKATREVCDERD